MKYSYKNAKLVWKKDYGDDEYTEDICLWINDNPSSICISGAEMGWYGVLYCNDKQLAIGDTRRELKEMLFEDFVEYLHKEIDLYSDLN